MYYLKIMISLKIIYEHDNYQVIYSMQIIQMFSKMFIGKSFLILHPVQEK